jgi:CspA family cold shock protein
MQGTIKRVVREKGFGFILSPDGKDVFFHRNGLQGMDFEGLQEGTTVEFDIEQGAKGPRAANVRPSAG